MNVGGVYCRKCNCMSCLLFCVNLMILKFLRLWLLKIFSVLILILLKKWLGIGSWWIVLVIFKKSYLRCLEKVVVILWILCVCLIFWVIFKVCLKKESLVLVMYVFWLFLIMFIRLWVRLCLMVCWCVK